MKTLILAAAMIGMAAPACAQPRDADWFGSADANRDGAVSRAEFVAYRSANFDKLDRNGDNVVSPTDFPRLARFRPQLFAQLTDGIGDADRNGDGAVSRAEFAAAPPVLFDRANANRDDRVTKPEFDAARAAFRKQAKN